jgi:hypothetical protein
MLQGDIAKTKDTINDPYELLKRFKCLDKIYIKSIEIVPAVAETNLVEKIVNPQNMIGIVVIYEYKGGTYAPYHLSNVG